VAAAAVGATHLLLALLALTPSMGAAWTIALVIGATAWWVEFVRRGARHLSLERSALWVEERVPDLHYALVSTLTPHASSQALNRTIDHVLWRRAEQRALARAMWHAGALAAVAASIWLGSRIVPVVDRVPRGTANRIDGQRAGRSTAFDIRAGIVPPPYSGLPRQTLRDPSNIRALVGSRLTFDVSDSSATLRLGSQVAPSTVSAGERRSEMQVPARSQVITIASARGSHVVAIDVRPDSAPSVTLTRPVRDTVLATPTGTVTLGATLQDDFGLAGASFEFIVSSGDGESFTFRSGTVGARALGGALTGAIAATVALDALQLKPGDIVHLRAVARDGNDVTGPGIGRSETRTLRIARSGEYDSVAVEGAAPPEEDKSMLSQRMLINMAEALHVGRKTLGRDLFLSEAARIARDQGRLRRQVGDIVFDRLGADPIGEHEHNAADGGRPLTKEALLKAAEEATKAGDEVLDFATDETPVTAVNRPLLEAYNAMWDAGRELGIAEPKRALPHMYRALAAIQRARSAERLYLRGKAPRVVVDVARVRLQGMDRGASSARTARVATNPAHLTDYRRFASAVEGLTASPAATIDSLLVLRVSLMERNAAAARALDAAIEALRTSHDATELLIQTRRALGEIREMADSVSRWSRRGAGPS
jgi:hypothetical protein